MEAKRILTQIVIGCVMTMTLAGANRAFFPAPFEMSLMGRLGAQDFC
jgi:hypothetical protein